MEYKNIQLEFDGDLSIIKIARPEVRNAINNETIDEIHLALDELDHNPDVRIIVFTGTGDRAFSAGADISSIAERTIFDAFQAKQSELCKRVENLDKTTIAMINGHALGGGFELALACDIRVVTRDAKLGLPELNLSIIPGAGGTQRLTRMVGISRALDMILTGKLITGQEAFDLGITQYISEPDKLKDEVITIAEKILKKGPLAVQLVRQVVKYGNDTDIQTALYIEKLAQAILYTTEDKNEGANAFLEKRTPNFHMK